jgi:hypothetical protein
MGWGEESSQKVTKESKVGEWSALERGGLTARSPDLDAQDLRRWDLWAEE